MRKVAGLLVGVVGMAGLVLGGPQYHGGPILYSPTVYLIWYGDHANQGSGSVVSVIGDLVQGLGGTNYWQQIEGNYYDTVTYGYPVFNSGYMFKGTSSYTDNAGAGCGSQGCNLAVSGADPQGFDAAVPIVENAVANGLPVDGGAVYLVVAAQNVTVNGHSPCGFHTWDQHQTGSGSVRLTVGFVRVDMTAGCFPAQYWYDANNQTINSGQWSPNGDPGSDEVAYSVVHELIEAITDPWLAYSTTPPSSGAAWYTEVADECQPVTWSSFSSIYGTLQTDSLGRYWNVAVGSRKYLLPLLWYPVYNSGNAAAPNGYCTL